jgi:glycosyltransferase involved in cell wall biosynthesis
VTDRPSLVSVVMPAFDAARFVHAAIESVRGQTHEDWELVIADDGSTDGTADIVETIGDPRIRVLRGSHSGLPAVGRNRAIAHSSGAFVAFLDADDVWQPDKLSRQLALLSARPEFGLVHCGVAELGGRTVIKNAPPTEEPLVALLRENFVATSSVVVRRSALVEHGVFDEDPALRGAEDYELWLRLAPFAGFGFIPEPLILYRVHEAGLSADERRNRSAGLVARERVRARDPELYERLKPRFARGLGISRCLAGSPGSGRRELALAVRTDPRDLLAWKWLALSLLGGANVVRLRGLRLPMRRNPRYPGSSKPRPLG